MSKTSPTLTSAEQADLNAAAARVLGLRSVEVETTNARPITYAEIEALASGARDEFSGYVRDQVGFLRPATFTVRTSRSREFDHEPVFAAIPNPRPNGPEMIADRSTVVGRRVMVEAKIVFGQQETLRLFTTEQAEVNARALGQHSGERDADTVYLADETAAAVPLMPVYGAEANVSFIVAGLDDQEVAARIRKALEAEFGQDMSERIKILTRPVENRRVDVFSSDGKNTPLAVGILFAEIGRVMAGRGAVRHETHQPNGLMIGSS